MNMVKLSRLLTQARELGAEIQNLNKCDDLKFKYCDAEGFDQQISLNKLEIESLVAAKQAEINEIEAAIKRIAEESEEDE